MNPYLYFNLVNNWDRSSTDIKKTNHFIVFKLNNIKFLDILNFFSRGIKLILCQNIKEIRNQGFLSYEKFDHPANFQNTANFQYDAFHGKFRSCNLLEAEYNDYFNVLKLGMRTERASIKLKLPKLAIIGILKSSKFKKTLISWTNEPINCFLRWRYRKKLGTQKKAKKMLFITTKSALVRAWLYINKFGRTLSTQTYRCKKLGIHGGW